MKVAYVDTSCYVAIAFGEPAAGEIRSQMTACGQLVSSNLLEAELRSAFTREQVPFDSTLLSGLSWLLPNRSLGPELALVLQAGYVRGADLWHLAAALFLAGESREVGFLTLDHRQLQVARLLGFRTVPGL